MNTKDPCCARVNRRAFLSDLGMGFTGMALGSLLAKDGLARNEELEIPVQVNGKLRSRVTASPDIGEEELRVAALADEKVRSLTAGREVVKVIVVPKRLVNVVVR